MLTILHAPSWAPGIDLASVRLACSTRADSIGFTEAFRVISLLQRRVAYRCRVGRSQVDTRAVNSPRGDAGDVPILIRRRRPMIDWDALRVCPPGHPPKYAPERWITDAVYDHPFGDVAHINAHPDPRFVDPFAEHWARYMDRLRSRVRFHQRRGRIVILTGDLQTGALADWFDTLDLAHWRAGIDYVGYSPHLRLAERSILRDPAQVREEHPHPWMLARFAL